MAERTGYWGGAPNRWAEPAGDDADPTGGRHAFDRDAALTPIFTTLRRTARQSHLRPVPSDHRADPQTAEIPIIPPLRAVGPAPDRGVDRLPPAPSPSETTTWWRSPIGFPAAEPAPRDAAAYDTPSYDTPSYGMPSYDRVQHDVVPYQAAYDPAPYDPAPYDPAPYGRGPYDRDAYDRDAYDRDAYEQGHYAPTPHGSGQYPPAQYEPVQYEPARYTAAPYTPAPYERVSSDGGPYDAGSYGAGPYDEHHESGPYDSGRFGAAPPDRTVEPVPPAAAGHHDVTPFARRSARDVRAPGRYDPMTDTGRHHRRLAPAGW